MLDSVFRVYDIRGQVGKDFITDEVYTLTRAILYHCIQKNPSVKTVVVGMDGRIHSPLIKEKIIQALLDSGVDVIDIGICSSPLLYFSQYWLSAQAGFMVTASHNPPEYNGIKMMLDRCLISNTEIQKIKNYYREKKQIKVSNKSEFKSYSLVQEYCLFLKRLFPQLVGLSLEGAFDCGNATVGPILVDLAQQMEWKYVHFLYETIDGAMPHHVADPSDEKNMSDLKKCVAEKRLQFGVAFDGDGDRMGAVTSDGRFVSGDLLLALYAQDILQYQDGIGVVFDCKCSSVLTEVIKKNNGIPYMSPSGHSFIKERMQEYGALLGGELSSHLFFKDRYFGFDDGLYAALRLIELFQKTGKSLKDLFLALPKKICSPEIRIQCREGEGPKIVAAVESFFKTKKGFEISTLDGMRCTTSYGWGLLRSSNTQPVVCLRLEANSDKEIALLKGEFVTALSPWYSVSFLEKNITW